MKVFGYNQPDGDAPFIRLACQAKAEGNVTIVIPPWNAVFGKQVRGNIEDSELEPVTTSRPNTFDEVADALMESLPELESKPLTLPPPASGYVLSRAATIQARMGSVDLP